MLFLKLFVDEMLPLRTHKSEWSVRIQRITWSVTELQPAMSLRVKNK